MGCFSSGSFHGFTIIYIHIFCNLINFVTRLLGLIQLNKMCIEICPALAGLISQIRMYIIAYNPMMRVIVIIWPKVIAVGLAVVLK
jgi:hypothetical protein